MDKKNTETGLVEEVATPPVVQTWVETCRSLYIGKRTAHSGQKTD